MHKNQVYRIMLDEFEETQGSYLDLSPLNKLSAEDLGDSTFMLKLLREFLEIEILDFIEEPAKSDVKFFETCIQENKGWNPGWRDCLKYASNSVRNDKLFFLRLIEKIGYYQCLFYANETVRFDNEVTEAVFKLLSDDLNAIQYCSLSARSRYDLIRRAVNHNGLNLQFASDKLKLDKLIVKEAVSKSPKALEFASDAIQNDIEFVLSAVKADQTVSKFIGSDALNSEQFINHLIEEIDYIDENLFNRIPHQFKTAKPFLQKVLLKSRYISSGAFSDFIDENDREFFLEAVKNKGGNLVYASDRLRDDKTIVHLAVESDPSSLEYASERLFSEPNLIILALKKWLAIIEKIPNQLRAASEKAQDNREIVLAAVSAEGDTLEYASPRLKDDIELLKIAIDTNNYAHSPLKYASTRLRDEKSVVTLAVEKNGHALEFASERLKNDKDLLSRAMVTSVHAYQYASKTLRDDQEFAMKAYAIDTVVLNYVSDRVNRILVDL